MTPAVRELVEAVNLLLESCRQVPAESPPAFTLRRDVVSVTRAIASLRAELEAASEPQSREDVRVALQHVADADSDLPEDVPDALVDGVWHLLKDGDSRLCLAVRAHERGQAVRAPRETPTHPAAATGEEVVPVQRVADLLLFRADGIAERHEPASAVNELRAAAAVVRAMPTALRAMRGE